MSLRQIQLEMIMCLIPFASKSSVLLLIESTVYSVNGNGSVACFEASGNIKNYAEKYKCNVARAVRLVIETNSVEIHGNCFNGRENERTRERRREKDY